MMTAKDIRTLRASVENLERASFQHGKAWNRPANEREFHARARDDAYNEYLDVLISIQRGE